MGNCYLEVGTRAGGFRGRSGAREGHYGELHALLWMGDVEWEADQGYVIEKAVLNFGQSGSFSNKPRPKQDACTTPQRDLRISRPFSR